MKTLELLVLAVVLVVAPGCKKTASDTAGSGSAAAASPAKAPATDEADHVVVLGKHRPAKPTDPVVVHIDRFKVVKTSFDPQHLEGGQATIELDLASLRTGSSERDDDLKSPEYIDVGKFATATIDITNVKTKAGTTYTADAAVTLRGATKTYPVTFEVIDQKPDRVRIKGEHTFSRLDFSIGGDPAADPGQRVDTELTIQMVLTLAKA